jgi:hypothetical protein
MEVPAAGRLSGLREEAGQFAFLARHFFGRLFRNEVVDFEDQMKERLIATLSILAIIVFWSSELLLFKYHFVADTGTSWQEKSYAFLLVMIIFGIVTLLEWDVLFPDRQDFLNLTPLPVRLRTIFAAKLASFVLFIGLFSVAMNIGSSVLFAIYLSPWRAGADLLFAGRYMAAHLAGAFAACVFVFFACVLLQFLLMAVLPYRAYRRISFFVRGALLAGLIFLLLAFLVEPGILDKSFRSLASLKAAGDPFLFRFPPFWFVGLYERLLGTSDPIFRAWAGTAVSAIVLSLGAFGAASGLSYHRHVRKTLEISGGNRKLTGFPESLSGLFGRMALRAPEEKAVFAFFSKTLRANPKHRITMTYYLAAAAGAIALYIVANREGFRFLTPSNSSLLVQPLFLSFVILGGLRTLVNVPASPGANWVFEVTDTGRVARYASGVKKAVLFRWLLPLAGLVFVSHLVLWGFAPALEHALFGLAMAGLGLEALFFHFRKVPFACTYLPGKIKFHTWGVPFAIACLFFFSITAVIERALLRAPAKFGIFYAAAAVIWLTLRAGNRRFYRRASLIFEEQPAPALVTFPEAP